MLSPELAPDVDAHTQALFLFLFLGTLAFLVGLFVGILKIIDHFKRKPSIDSEFATKAELTAAEVRLSAAQVAAEVRLGREVARIEKEQVSIGKKLDDLTKTVNVEFQGMERSLGRIEGKIDGNTAGAA